MRMLPPPPPPPVQPPPPPPGDPRGAPEAEFPLRHRRRQGNASPVDRRLGGAPLTGAAPEADPPLPPPDQPPCPPPPAFGACVLIDAPVLAILTGRFAERSWHTASPPFALDRSVALTPSPPPPPPPATTYEVYVPPVTCTP